MYVGAQLQINMLTKFAMKNNNIFILSRCSELKEIDWIFYLIFAIF